MPKTTNGYGYAPDATGDQVTVLRPSRQALGDTPKVVLFCHGVTGSSLDVLNPSTGLYWHVKALVDAGYVVISADWGGTQNWSGPATMAKWPWMLALASNTGSVIGTLNPIGGYPTRVGLLGGSMGGLCALNLYKRNPSQVAGALLFNPVTDLRWADAEAGYTPAYSTGGLTGSWASNITAAYPFNTLVTGSVTLNQVATTIPVQSTTGFAASGSLSTANSNGAITVNYTGVTGTSFTGCTIVSGTQSLAANYLITQGTGAYSNSTGYRVVDEYATWKNKTIKVIHASDDGTVPNQASVAFVNGVNDPGVTFRTPQPTGGHVNVFANVPTSETVAFFNSLTW